MTSGIRQWLEAQGLVQYAEAFELNDIDVSLLTDLNDQVLKDVGVASAGHRLRLLGAIKAHAKVEKLATDQAPSAAASNVARSEKPPVAIDGERRQLTVMFCDLVGSTVLSRQLDPEALRGLMRAYQQTCGPVIQKYDGHVAQYLGDGLMVYFGWPKAHEDDAERAVRASLEIVEAVKTVLAPSPLQVRVGIATGAVVVGETGNGDASVPKLAVGETPNLAARLQGLAGANQIVIASATHRLLGLAFEYADLGENALKGIVEPVRAFQILRAARTEGRFEATHGGNLIPLVGREEEIAVLMRRWEQAKQGEGQVVLLGGEPGIGKSRIIQALRERIADEPHIRLRYQCSPFHTNSALHPFIEQIERAAAFSRDDGAEQKLDKLEVLLRQGGGDIWASQPLIAALLSLPGGRYPALTYSPQKQKEKTLEALSEQVEGLSAKSPVLMMFEDVHWVDPTTQEVLDLIVPRLARHHILLVVTFRPEYSSKWAGQPHVTAITLSRLSRRIGAQIVQELTGDKPLPPAVLDQILIKTDGVPLFVEELTKATLESGLLRDCGDRYELTGPLTDLAIPSTLQDSLMARLDRLAPVKEVAQIGACIGREFPYELVSAVWSQGDGRLQDALDQLAQSELIFRRGSPPDAVYTFKHALVQDAAYQSLLKSKRLQFHDEIARVLEKDFADRVANEPELLAHHYTRAGLVDRAVPYWIQAGQRALSRMALAEAVGHLTKALSENERLPACVERDRGELDIRLLLSAVYLASLGWAAVEVVQTLGPARDLAIRLGQHDKLVAILYYIWFHHLMRCEYQRTGAIVEELNSLARSRNDSTSLAVAGMAEALLHGFTGDSRQARQFTERMVEAYDIEQHGQLAQTYIHDPKCLTLMWAAYFLWVLGYPDQAREASVEQLELARKLGHAFNLFACLSVGTVGLTVRGDTHLAREWLAEAKAIATEHAMTFMGEVIVPFWDGCALIEQGDHAAGYAMQTVGSKGWRSTGPLHLVPFANMMRARALTGLARFDEARGLVEEALDIVAQTGHRSEEAELHRVLGELQLRQPNPDLRAANASFLKALDVARAQEARGWELRAATSLARLWQSQGKRKQAQDMLAPIYNWFTEGFDTKDLKEAKALLDELAG